ncbi:hypothetical protein Tco_0073869, partial [Tanacetum coccineum]
FIMAHLPQQQDVLRDQLYLPDKQYDLMDANKKIDLINLLCSNESKILGDILNHHPLRFSLDQCKFFLDTKEFKFLVDDFRRVFQLPQATEKNNVGFVATPTVNYAELVWEGLHYLLMHLTALIPYPRFTMIIVDHFMTENPDIPKRLHEHYHRVANDEVVKSIFNSGKNKESHGMKIPGWILTEEMKLTAHYQMTLSAHRIPNPDTTHAELSDPCKPTVIRFHVPRQLDPETPIPTASKIYIDIQEHLVVEEIETMVEGTENVDVDEFMDEIFNDQEDPGNRIEPGSHKESLEGKGIEEIRDTPLPTPIRFPRTHIAPLSLDKETLHELTVTDPTHSSSTPSKVTQEHFTHYKSVFHIMNQRYSYMFRHLQKSFMPRKDFMEMEKALKSTLKKVFPTMVDKRTFMATLIAEAVQKKRDTLRAELSMQVTNVVTNVVPPQVNSFLRNYSSNNILHVHPTQAANSSAQDLQYQLYLKMKDDEQVRNADLSIWWSLKIKFEKPKPHVAPCRLDVVRTRDHEDHHHDDARPEG